jgi:hypothetical protein
MDEDLTKTIQTVISLFNLQNMLGSQKAHDLDLTSSSQTLCKAILIFKAESFKTKTASATILNQEMIYSVGSHLRLCMYPRTKTIPEKLQCCNGLFELKKAVRP